MLLAHIAQLPRPARVDLLSALSAVHVEDDGSMTDRDLLEDIASAVRDLLGAREGELTETLRERLAFVATTVDATWRLPDESVSLDLVTDAEIAWVTADWLFNEALGVADEGSSPQVAEALGRRFLAHGAPDRSRRADEVIRLGDLAERRDRTSKERQEMIAAAVAGTPGVEVTQLASPTSAHRVGLWLSEALSAAHRLFQSDPDPAQRLVTVATQPAADFLSAWLLSVATTDRPEGREKIKASSSRTRAQWTRTARAIAALSLAVYAYSASRPEPLWERRPGRRRRA